MIAKNLDYLKDSLLNLGFGEGMNAELEKNMEQGLPGFQLQQQVPHYDNRVEYTLNFKKSAESDMFFFNTYKAELKHEDPARDKAQTFYVNNGTTVTAKEAFNLLEGRSVYRNMSNKAGEKYKAWVKLDFENKTDTGNHKIQQYKDAWNFKPERAIDQLPIVGIDHPENREKLMRSLEKGNTQQVTVVQEGKEVKIYLQANPAEHRVDLLSEKFKPLKLEDYKKPELKAAKQEQSQEQAQKKSRGQKVSA